MSVRRFAPLIALVAFAAAAYLIWRALQRHSMDEIVAAIGAISATQLLLAFAFTAASYLTLTGFDTLAVRYTGHPLPWRRTALTSFVALSLGHSIGMAALSSGAVRYRFYSRWGLSVGDVGRVILFCGATVAVGLATLGGAVFLLQPTMAASLTGLGGGSVLTIGLGCVAAVAGYLVLAAGGRRRVHIRHWRVDTPDIRLAVGQVVLGTINFALVAAALHQLLASGSVDYVTVASAYVIGITAGIISHVPGGLGVLEATVLALMPDAAVIGALVAFRVVYFLVPLIIGSTLFAAIELLWRWRPRERP